MRLPGATHLADATALALGRRALLVVLLDLVGEEGVKDLVHQLGGGGFGRPLAVLLDLCRVANGLSPGGSPVKRRRLVTSGWRLWLSEISGPTPDGLRSDGIMEACRHTTASGHATKQADGKDVRCRVHLRSKKARWFVTAKRERPEPTVTRGPTHPLVSNVCRLTRAK